MAFKMKAKGFGNNPFKKNFPDLTGDGKVTKADVLKGRGVFKKNGNDDKVVPSVPKKPEFMSDGYFKSLSDKFKIPIKDIKDRVNHLVMQVVEARKMILVLAMLTWLLETWLKIGTKVT